MKNIKYNKLQEAIERLVANANRYAGLESRDATDKHLDGRAAQLNEMASRIDEMTEQADEGFALDADKVAARDAEKAEAKKREPRSHRASVSSIGMVNTCNSFNANYGTIWNVWPEGKMESNILVERGGKFKLIHTSGDLSDGTWIRKGDTLDLKQDQTQACMGQWNVVAHAPHTKEGLMELGATAGKKSIATATFK